MGELQGMSPPLPNTLQQIHEKLRLVKSPTKIKEFLLVNNDVNYAYMLMFFTQSNLNFLVKYDAVLIDGTFCARLNLFSQIFIAHGKKHTYELLMYTFFLIRKRWIASSKKIKNFFAFHVHTALRADRFYK